MSCIDMNESVWTEFDGLVWAGGKGGGRALSLEADRRDWNITFPQPSGSGSNYKHKQKGKICNKISEWEIFVILPPRR